LARFLFAQAFFAQRGDEQVGDADAGLACAQEQEFMVFQLAAGKAQRTEDAGDGDAGRALNVVIEGTDFVPICFL
jgi:hypothetical protein